VRRRRAGLRRVQCFWLIGSTPGVGPGF
jgi:hypothetical protein